MRHSIIDIEAESMQNNQPILNEKTSLTGSVFIFSSLRYDRLAANECLLSMLEDTSQVMECPSTTRMMDIHYYRSFIPILWIFRTVYNNVKAAYYLNINGQVQLNIASMIPRSIPTQSYPRPLRHVAFPRKLEMYTTPSQTRNSYGIRQHSSTYEN